MPSRKIISGLVLATGAICIVVALVGAVVQLLTADASAPLRARSTRAAEAPAASVNRVVRGAQTPAVPDAAPARTRMSAQERERAVTEVLLSRMAKTSDVIDGAWILQVCVHIRDVAALRSFHAELLALGETKYAEYAARQRREKKAISSDSRSFVSQVRKEIYATTPSAGRLDKYGRAHLAIALFMQSAAHEGIENVDAAFMTALFKELVALYSVRRELTARAGQDPAPWMQQQQRVLEAAVLDRYVRLGQVEERIRQQHKNAQGGAAVGLVTMDLLHRSLYENLLQLGQLNLEAAEAETRDRDQLRVLVDRAFALMAMVYQRTQSPESLVGVRRINEIQRGVLYRLARTKWKRAQLATAAPDQDAAAEYYFRATQFLNEAIAQSVGPDKVDLVKQFVVLKREIEAWHAARQAHRQESAAPQ
jgi:hypothetical protein